MARDTPRLVAVTFPEPARRPAPALLAGLEPFVDLLILRLPGTSRASYEACARELLACDRRPPIRLRAPAQLALELGADGVHLGEGDPPPERVRREHPGLAVSCSRHDAAGLARSEGAEFALLSPVAPTGSKPGLVPRPLEELGRWAREAPLPVLALGGVDAGLAAALRREGFAGLAVMRAIFGAADPAAAAAALCAAWERG